MPHLPPPIDLFAAASAVARELEERKMQFAAAGRLDCCEHIDRELWGYPPGAQVPGYRRVPATLLAEISDGIRQEVAVLDAHDDLVVGEGLLRLRELPGLLQAARCGATEFTSTLDAGINALLAVKLRRQRPGYYVVRAWLRVPMRGFEELMPRIAAHAREPALNPRLPRH